MTVELIELDCIYPNPWQTRMAEVDPEYIAGLAVDIARNGLLQTPIGRRRGDDEEIVELAFGHNRLAAFVHLAADIPDTWGEMPVDIRELSDEQMAAFAWSENEKRRDITAIERARAIERRIADFGWSNRDVEEHLGVDHSTVSNTLRLLKLPDYIQDAIQEGKISERQAMAILVLFEVPEFKEIPYFRTRKEIVDRAFEGMSSDWLRKEVSEYLRMQGKDLAGAEFSLTETFTEGRGVYCGMCSTCDKRMASRNLCFDRDCFEEKTDRRHLLYLAAASVKSGYGVLDPNKEGYPSAIPYYLVETIKATKCKNLVLAWGASESEAHKIDGYPQAHLVCEKRNQSCSCVKGLRANMAVKRMEETEGRREPEHDSIPDPHPNPPPPERSSGEGGEDKVTSADLEEAARQARKEKLDTYNKRATVDELVMRRLVEGFAADHPGAFFLAANRYTYPSKPPEIDACYVALAMGLVRNIVPAEANSVAEMLNIANRKLESLGLEPVRLEKTLAEVFDGQ